MSTPAGNPIGLGANGEPIYPPMPPAPGASPTEEYDSTGKPIIPFGTDGNGNPVYTPPAFSLNGTPNPDAVNFKGGQAYDSQGYPIPPGGEGYDPTIAPPLDPSTRPFSVQPGSVLPLAVVQAVWDRQWQAATANQAKRVAWQQANTSQMAPAITHPAAPAAATPFTSAGVDLTQQGKGENYIDSVLQNYRAQGVPQTTNNAQGAYQQFQASTPADVSPYYDAARASAFAGIDNQASARGAYGSSAALGMESSAAASLAAQQANAQAGYGLQYANAAGSLAQSADARSLANSNNQMSWAQGLSGLASADQSLGEARNQSLFNNNTQLANTISGIIGAGDKGSIGSSTQANDDIIATQLGQANDQTSATNAVANVAATNNSGTLNSATAAAKALAAWSSPATTPAATTPAAKV